MVLSISSEDTILPWCEHTGFSRRGYTGSNPSPHVPVLSRTGTSLKIDVQLNSNVKCLPPRCPLLGMILVVAIPMTVALLVVEPETGHDRNRVSSSLPRLFASEHTCYSPAVQTQLLLCAVKAPLVYLVRARQPLLQGFEQLQERWSALAALPR